jgi:hypothetical protein
MAYLVSQETADWINAAKQQGGDIRSRHRVARPGGGDGNADGAILGVVTTSSDPSTGLDVTLYGNGPGAANTGFGTVYLPECVAGSYVPTGMWVVCWPGLVWETGGSEQ